MAIGDFFAGDFLTGDFFTGDNTPTAAPGASGSAAASAEGSRRDPRRRTGLEPIKKVYPAPPGPAPARKFEIPPWVLRSQTQPAAALAPREVIDRHALDIAGRMQQALDASTALRAQDADDAEDIADIIAMIDQGDFE